MSRTQGTVKICTYYLKSGRCKRGKECKFDHIERTGPRRYRGAGLIGPSADSFQLCPSIWTPLPPRQFAPGPRDCYSDLVSQMNAVANGDTLYAVTNEQKPTVRNNNAKSADAEDKSAPATTAGDVKSEPSKIEITIAETAVRHPKPATAAVVKTGSAAGGISLHGRTALHRELIRRLPPACFPLEIIALVLAYIPRLTWLLFEAVGTYTTREGIASASYWFEYRMPTHRRSRWVPDLPDLSPPDIGLHVLDEHSTGDSVGWSSGGGGGCSSGGGSSSTAVPVPSVVMHDESEIKSMHDESDRALRPAVASSTPSYSPERTPIEASAAASGMIRFSIPPQFGVSTTARDKLMTPRFDFISALLLAVPAASLTPQTVSPNKTVYGAAMRAQLVAEAATDSNTVSTEGGMLVASVVNVRSVMRRGGTAPQSVYTPGTIAFLAWSLDAPDRGVQYMWTDTDSSASLTWLPHHKLVAISSQFNSKIKFVSLPPYDPNTSTTTSTTSADGGGEAAGTGAGTGAGTTPCQPKYHPTRTLSLPHPNSHVVKILPYYDVLTERHCLAVVGNDNHCYLFDFPINHRDAIQLASAQPYKYAVRCPNSAGGSTARNSANHPALIRSVVLARDPPTVTSYRSPVSRELDVALVKLPDPDATATTTGLPRLAYSQSTLSSQTDVKSKSADLKHDASGRAAVPRGYAVFACYREWHATSRNWLTSLETGRPIILPNTRVERFLRAWQHHTYGLESDFHSEWAQLDPINHGSIFSVVCRRSDPLSGNPHPNQPTYRMDALRYTVLIFFDVCTGAIWEYQPTQLPEWPVFPEYGATFSDAEFTCGHLRAVPSLETSNGQSNSAVSLLIVNPRPLIATAESATSSGLVYVFDVSRIPAVLNSIARSKAAVDIPDDPVRLLRTMKSMELAQTSCGLTAFPAS